MQEVSRLFGSHVVLGREQRAHCGRGEELQGAPGT